MTEQNHPLQLIRIDDHWVTLFFPFDFPVDSKGRRGGIVYQALRKITLRQGFAELPLPEPCRNLVGKKAGDKVWETARLPVKEDLVPPIQHILDGSVGPYPALKLSHLALQLCNGNQAVSQPALTVKLDQKAQQRLGHQRGQLDFSILAVNLLMLDIGTGCLTVKLKFHDVFTAMPLLEGLYALCRNYIGRQTLPVRWLKGAEDKWMSGLATLLESLAPIFGTKGAARCYGLWRKTFSYSALKIAERVNDRRALDKLGLRLAKKYTEAYLPDDDQLANAVYRPFENIAHFCTQEGGALIVEPGAGHAIEQFLNDMAKSVYFPICLVAFLEYQALTTISQKQGCKIHFANPKRGDLAHLQRIQTTVYNFRLNYRFSQISPITMHNAVHRHWRQAFNTHALLEELSCDINEIENFVSGYRQRQTHKTLNTLELLVVFVGGLLTVSQIFDINLYRFLTGGPAPEWLVDTALVMLAVVIGYVLIKQHQE